MSEIKPSLIAEYTGLEAAGQAGLALAVRIEKSSEVHHAADGVCPQGCAITSV